MAMPDDAVTATVALRSVPAAAQASTRPLLAGPIRLGSAAGPAGLQVRVGHASRGAGKPNEDFYGIANPGTAAIAARGLAVAVADGVSGDTGARTAAETTVRSLLEDYYDTPAHWNIGRALDRVLRAINDWLVGENLRRPDGEGMVSTVSLLLFKDARYCVAHVGDTRVYRRRAGALRQLTTDHTWPRRDMRHVLRRAIGLDTHLVAEFADGELQVGDAFLIASDGVWEVLGERALHDALERGVDPQSGADLLVKSSIERQLQYMGRNDATAVIVHVEAVA
ncbi:MAG: serine/threonine-protein phosphatase [Burkholderiales bacterium]|nr:serine/threonine-protein phosphatase [Burkholderiales bacterium]